MDHNELRRHFPVTEHWAFFDHAAVAPLPDVAREAIVAWANDVACQGVVTAAHWQRRIQEIRERFGQFLSVDPEEIAFVKNTSEGIGIVAEGYPWQAGDNVVTCEDEYPANVYPWLNLASRGVELRRVATREQGRISLDDLCAAIDSRTRIVSLSFVEFATGFRNDLDAVGQLCHERGIHFFVDAIQGLGALPLDLSTSPVDFIAADGHKWLLGPEGAGIFWIRRNLIERMRPIGIGWNSVIGAWEFSTIDFRLKPHAGRWESGTLNVGGILGMGASLELLRRFGIDQVARQIRNLTDHFCHKIESSGWQVFSSRRENEWSGIVSLITPEGVDPVALTKRLRAEKIVVNHRAGRLRVSPHVYNTLDEIDRLVNLLGDLR